MNAPRILAVALLLPASLACSSEPEPVQSASPAVPSAGPSAAGQPAATGGLSFTNQPGWVVEKPSSGMRKAQYRLLRAEHDFEDATLVVYYFGAEAGSVDDNVERWVGQFDQPDGRPSEKLLKKSTRTVNGMKVHDVDLSGIYVAETTPGSGERVRKEGWRMLAAIIEAPDGPYYAKIVGPAATVGHWEESFKKFVAEAKPGSSGAKPDNSGAKSGH